MIIKHDAFARGGFHRIAVSGDECRWCGNKKKVYYSYHWEPDDWFVCKAKHHAHMPFCDFKCFSDFTSN